MTRFCSVMLAAVAGLGCDRPAPEPTADAPSSAPPTASTAVTLPPPPESKLRAARLHMEKFLAADADRQALRTALAPTPDDFPHVFESGLAARAKTHYARRPVSLDPKPEQTELLMWKVSTEDLRRGTGDAAKCPAEYESVADELRPGVAWYCLRFVKPAEKTGQVASGLSLVNGRWVMFDAPWLVE